MDVANELSQFLTSQRAKVTPEQAGLPSYGQRRVPGLRREEVASLAGVSVEYYRRLERGNATGAPTSSTSPAPPGRRDRFLRGVGAGRSSSASGRRCSASSTASGRRRP